MVNKKEKIDPFESLKRSRPSLHGGLIKEFSYVLPFDLEGPLREISKKPGGPYGDIPNDLIWYELDQDKLSELKKDLKERNKLADQEFRLYYLWQKDPQKKIEWEEIQKKIFDLNETIERKFQFSKLVVETNTKEFKRGEEIITKASILYSPFFELRYFLDSKDLSDWMTVVKLVLEHHGLLTRNHPGPVEKSKFLNTRAILYYRQKKQEALDNGATEKEAHLDASKETIKIKKIYGSQNTFKRYIKKWEKELPINSIPSTFALFPAPSTPPV